MAKDRWSQHAHVDRGGLPGWCESCSPDSRHAALRAAAARDGKTAVIRRLNFLRNIANRKNNMELHRVAQTDLEWAEREL